MSVVVKRISMVMLLSTALANGQAEASKFQSFRGQVRKVFESQKTLSVTCAVTGVCTGGAFTMISLGHLDAALIAGWASFPSFILLVHSIYANIDKQYREKLESLDRIRDEAQQHGEKSALNLVAKRIKKKETNTDYDSVEVNNRADMIINIFMQADMPLAVLKHPLDTIVDENGGFPLTVKEDGLLFNDGSFTSYNDLFNKASASVVDHTSGTQGRASLTKSF